MSKVREEVFDGALQAGSGFGHERVPAVLLEELEKAQDSYRQYRRRPLTLPRQEAFAASLAWYMAGCCPKSPECFDVYGDYAAQKQILWSEKKARLEAEEADREAERERRQAKVAKRQEPVPAKRGPGRPRKTEEPVLT